MSGQAYIISVRVRPGWFEHWRVRRGADGVYVLAGQPFGSMLAVIGALIHGVGLSRALTGRSEPLCGAVAQRYTYGRV